jgi:uncharacterized protein
MARRVTVVLGLALVLVGLLAIPAYAHVEISPDGPVAADGSVKVTLEVPNERSDSGTKQVELEFPTSPALRDVKPGDVPGWTASVTNSAAGNVASVTWTGGPLKGEEKVEFPLTLGPVPAGTKSLTFKAVQTYEDGRQVDWIEATPPGGDEPEHPAPVLSLSGKSSDEGGGHSDAASGGKEAKHGDSDDGTSTGEIVALVAVFVVVVGGGTWFLVRRRGGARA